MTGSTLPQSVKPVFHEFCNCCKYLEVEINEHSFYGDNQKWTEYEISCAHYEACGRARDIFREEGEK